MQWCGHISQRWQHAWRLAHSLKLADSAPAVPTCSVLHSRSPSGCGGGAAGPRAPPAPPSPGKLASGM